MAWNKKKIIQSFKIRQKKVKLQTVHIPKRQKQEKFQTLRAVHQQTHQLV